MATAVMKFTVSGDDLGALTIALAALPAFSALPTELWVDNQSKEVTSGWLMRWLPKAKKELRAEWNDETKLWQSRTTVLAMSPALAEDFLGLSRFIAGLPFERAALWTPFGADWTASGYKPPGFSDGHLPHGWACMFKGAGHDRLVSRRWLDHGPWRLTRYPDDVSLVQFYDLEAASATTALAQAKPGHERMGISRSGGFIQTNYVYYHQLDGVYDAATRTYKIPVAVRELPQTEMLDACALRLAKHNDPKTPIDHVGFVFVMGPDEAKPYLHELWLRELQCWAVVDGKDVRLDQDYTPSPSKPSW
jgi:hypothetical protein